MTARTSTLEVVKIDEAFLTLDPDTSGIHRRLMAGLDSVAGRAGCPVVVSVMLGRGARDEGRSYDDLDFIVTLVPGHSGYRKVSGHIGVPLHVTCGGNVTRDARYEPLRYDLTVGSSATPDEVTRFVGNFGPYAPSVVVRDAMTARRADDERAPGPVAMYEILRNSAYYLLSRAANAALIDGWHRMAVGYNRTRAEDAT